MSIYLKDLGIHVYLATIKDSYFINGKHLEANTKAIHAIKSTLNDDYLSRVSDIELAFVVWNTICSHRDQMPNEKESDSDDGSDASNLYYMVQGDYPLEINSEIEFDEGVDMPYDELALFYQQLLIKYELFKMENKNLKNKNDLDSKEKDSFKIKFEIISKENEILKTKLF